MKRKFDVLYRWVILGLPIAFLFFVVTNYGVNVPIWDDFGPLWDYLNIKETGKIDWATLTALHNEHRIVFPRMLIWLTAWLTHYNTKAMMFVSSFILSLAYLIFVFASVKKTVKDFDFADILGAFAVGLSLFGVVQYENLLWGFQIAWFLIEFCAVAGLACLGLYVQTKQKKYLFLVLLSAFISSFSSLHGLLIFPCYIAVLFLCDLSERKFDRSLWLVLLLSMLFIFLLYFKGYHTVSYHATGKAVSFFGVLTFIVKNLGGPLFGNENDGVAFWAGGGVLLLSVILLLYFFVKKRVKENILPIGAILFSLGFSFMVAMGRSGWLSMPSRYMTFSCLLLAADMILLSKFLRDKSNKGFFVSIVFFLLCEFVMYSDNVSLRYCDIVRQSRLRSIQVLKDCKNATADEIKIIYPLFEDEKDAEQAFEKIQKANLSVFYKKEN